MKDHERGRILIAATREAIEKSDAQSKTKNANGYAELLTSHISKENQLFVSWFSTLSSNDTAVLFDEFENLEERVIGKGQHEVYATELNNLELEINKLGNEPEHL